jgi:hypothetical protein
MIHVLGEGNPSNNSLREGTSQVLKNQDQIKIIFKG